MIGKWRKALAKRRARNALPAIALDVMADKLTYLSLQRMASLNGELARIRAEAVPGDLAEFGIALGGSAIVLAKQRDDRRFFGFDVFGQIPPPAVNDGLDAHTRFETIRAGKSSGIGGREYYGYVENLYDRVVGSFKDHGMVVDQHAIILNKGLFQETFRPGEGDRFALVHIDCDWYDPVKFCLQTISPHMSAGGAIIIDDYGDYEGCRKAADEILAADSTLSLERTDPHAVIRKH